MILYVPSYLIFFSYWFKTFNKKQYSQKKKIVMHITAGYKRKSKGLLKKRLNTL